MPPEDAKEYTWKWITGNELLSHRPCEICNAILTCNDENCYATIYDGENILGRVVATIKALQNRSVSMAIHHHVFCRRGLFVDLDTSTHCLGMFVQWLERPQGVGY